MNQQNKKSRNSTHTNKTSKNKSQLKDGFLPGIMRAIALLLLFVFLILFFIVINKPSSNQAEKDLQAFVAKIQKAGGKELCENGDGGSGLDNTQPWYQVYYKIPDNPRLTANIRAYATQFGYSLGENTELINQLKGVPDKNGDVIEPSGDGKFNPKADYLIGTRGGSELTITINRETSVPLYCEVDGYGDAEPTGNTNAILDIYLALPDRNQ